MASEKGSQEDTFSDVQQRARHPQPDFQSVSLWVASWVPQESLEIGCGSWQLPAFALHPSWPSYRDVPSSRPTETGITHPKGPGENNDPHFMDEETQTGGWKRPTQGSTASAGLSWRVRFARLPPNTYLRRLPWGLGVPTEVLIPSLLGTLAQFPGAVSQGSRGPYSREQKGKGAGEWSVCRVAQLSAHVPSLATSECDCPPR